MADTVIERIIEQSNQNDIRNMQFEQDILFVIKRGIDTLHLKVLNSVTDNISTLLKMESLANKIEYLYIQYVKSYKQIMLDRFIQYYHTAYEQTEDLIDMGNEIYGNMTQGVREMKEYGEDSIEFIRDHSFELMGGHSQQKINQIRSKLGDMYLKGNVSKSSVRSAIEKILDVGQSKAEEIAQTELSRAYNYGVMARLQKYQSDNPDAHVRKYWYGFKYSPKTCSYCQPRIGNVYELNNHDESLPAHVRCRCVWLPILDGWDKPISTSLTSRANMLNTAYSADMIYQRIGSRLGINYAEYIEQEIATDYLAGDRSPRVTIGINNARDSYIDDIVKKFDIAMDNANTHMSSEFNTQMKFWQKFVAGAVADNNRDLLNKSYEAVKALTILPWNEQQLSRWNSLINTINVYR